MVRLNVRVSEELLREIDEEARRRGCAKSEVVRERLLRGSAKGTGEASWLDEMEDLVGSVEGLPSDLSSRVKYYLRTTEFGKNRTHGRNRG